MSNKPSNDQDQGWVGEELEREEGQVTTTKKKSHNELPSIYFHYIKNTSNLEKWYISSDSTHTTARLGDFFVAHFFKLEYPQVFFLSNPTCQIFGYGDLTVIEDLESGFNLDKINSLSKKWLENENEFLIGFVNQDGLNLFRDSHCTLPIYFTSIENQFFASSRYSTIAEKSPQLTIDRSRLFEHITATLNYHNQTCFSEIKRLTEGTVTHFDGRNTTGIYTAQDQKISKSETVENTLIDAVTSRFNSLPKSTRLGVQLSCGIDSTLVTTALSTLLKPINTFTILFPDNLGRSQLNKLSQSKKTLPINSTVIKANNHPSIVNDPIDYYRQEIYLGTIDALAQKMKQKNISIVFTGIGGDELCLADRGEEDNFKNSYQETIQKTTTTPYLKILANKKFRYLPYQLPRMSHSVYQAHEATNEIFVRNGIWPIAPLASSSLTSTIRSLPKELRFRKEIIRRILDQAGLSAEVSRPTINENYQYFFEEMFLKKSEQLVTSVFNKSFLEENNLLAKNTLIDLYRRLQSSDTTVSKISLYASYTIETLLQRFREKIVI